MVNDTTPARPKAAMHPAYRLLTDMSLNLNGPIPNPQEMPALLSTQDGDPVFLAGQLNWLSSLPGHGKSWVVLLAAQQVLERGGFVVVFDYDNAGVVQWITRLRLLGIPDSDRLKIIQSPHLQPSDHRQIADLLKGYEPNLVVIDTATMAGAPTDGESVARWHHHHLRAYIEAEVGLIVMRSPSEGIRTPQESWTHRNRIKASRRKRKPSPQWQGLLDTHRTRLGELIGGQRPLRAYRCTTRPTRLCDPRKLSGRRLRNHDHPRQADHRRQP